MLRCFRWISSNFGVNFLSISSTSACWPVVNSTRRNVKICWNGAYCSRLAVAIRLRLDATVELYPAQLSKANRGDVQVDARWHVRADRDIDGVTLERLVLAHVTPDVHEMPRWGLVRLIGCQGWHNDQSRQPEDAEA